MAKTENSLFKLIKSLTASEKGYFKKFASRHIMDKKTKYVQLFDNIDSLEVYNHDLLLKKIRNKVFAKHLPQSENYLYQLILKSLNAYHSRITTEKQIKSILFEVEILYRKGLLKEAEELLKKAKHLLGSHHPSLLKLEILKLECRISILSLDPDKTEPLVQGLIEESPKLLEMEENVIRCRILYHKQSIATLRKGYMIDENFRKSFEKEAKELEQKDLSFSAKECLYQTLFNYYFFTKHVPSFTKYAHKRLYLLESNEKVITERPYMYITAMNNLMHALAITQQYDAFWEQTKKLNQFLGRFESNEAIQFRGFVVYNRELDVYCRTGRFKEGVESIKSMKLELKLKRYQYQAGKEFKVILYYHLASLFFGVGDYSKAIKWLNLLFNEKGVRNDVFKCAHILNLMLHVEIGSFVNLEYFVKSAKRYFNKHENASEEEKSIFSFFQKIPRISNNKLLTGHYQKLRNSLEPVREKIEEKVILTETFLLPWLESKIQNRSLSEVIKEKTSLVGF